MMPQRFLSPLEIALNALALDDFALELELFLLGPLFSNLEGASGEGDDQSGE